ncbi:hypothetical protein [Marinococcus luteus]|uniref:hypothetical protein n=1 Tax=Marinococcus luteus TaxID=1122204 RepID=UPI002ACD0D87|nr:hypothetical protein [Marinococcus luteus]MDZ5782625.1 hypothetical protein [Marinococcus luteus]
MIYHEWNRKWNELECHRLYRNDDLEKDKHGYIAWERELPFFKSYRSRAFYVAETSRYIEHWAAAEERKARAITRRFPEKFREQKEEADRLIQADYRLLLYRRLYEGRVPYVLMSPRQMEAWLQKEEAFQLQLTTLNAEEGPLQSLSFLKKQMGNKNYRKWFAQRRKEWEKIKKQDAMDLLSLSPYRSRQREEKKI